MSFGAQFLWFSSRGRLRLSKVVLALVVASVSVTLYQFWLLNQRLETVREATSDQAIWTMSQLEVDSQNFRLALYDAIDRAKTSGSPANLDSLRFAFDIYFSRTEILDKTAPVDSSRLAHLLVARDRFAGWIDSRNVASERELSDALAVADRDHGIVRDFALANLQAVVAATEAERREAHTSLQILLVFSLAVVALLAVSLVVVIQAAGREKRHSAALIRAATNLQQIIESTLDAVVVSDASGGILHFNVSAEQLFRVGGLGIPKANFFEAMGHQQQAPVGVNMAAILSPGWRAYADAGRAQATGSDLQGRIFPAEISVTSASDFDGRSIYIGFIRDIGDRIRLDSELRQSRDQARKDASAKARFLAVMSHEMRTPLHGAVASLDLLRDTPPGPEADALLEVALDCSRAALEQIGDVLELTRINSTRETPVPFDPAEAAREIIANLEPLAGERGNRIEFDTEGSVRLLLGQRRLYSRILYNLVGNAAKFTENGLIRIRLRTDTLADGSVELLTSVSDTGIGIAPEDQKRIFQDFETVGGKVAQYGKGTGLGLAIARIAAEEMGGDIGLTSALGQGSTFRFVLRLQAAETAPGRAPEVPGALPAPPKGLRILVVDDNQVNRVLEVEMIRRLGLVAAQAADGAAAVRLASETAFDVVLMDIGMPGMDGIEATARIRHAGRSKGARVVAVSAQLMPDAVRRLEDVGIRDILSKPFKLNDLARCLQGTATGMAPHDRPVIDTAQVDEIRALLGEEGAIGLAKDTLAEAVAALRQLRASRNGADLQRLAETLHRSAGSAAMLGAHGFAAAMRAGERQARVGDAGGLRETFDEALRAARVAADILRLHFTSELPRRPVVPKGTPKARRAL